MADGEGTDTESVGLKAGKLEDLLFLLLGSDLSLKVTRMIGMRIRWLGMWINRRIN